MHAAAASNGANHVGVVPGEPSLLPHAAAVRERLGREGGVREEVQGDAEQNRVGERQVQHAQEPAGAQREGRGGEGVPGGELDEEVEQLGGRQAEGGGGAERGRG